jgi:hypothetical protein
LHLIFFPFCSNDAPNGPIQLNTPGSTLLFGGRPEDFTILGAIASEFPYTGCLADISINGNRLDFTDSVINDASVAQKCFTPADMNAMSLERDQHEANGRRISQWDEDDDSSKNAIQFIFKKIYLNIKNV